jgi:endonuclease YncB( thermonuclease family)
VLRAVLLLLAIAMVAALLDHLGNSRETLSAQGLAVVVKDGDSFEIGTKRLRLDGIDAPEYRQSCTSAQGTDWECGKAARANLEAMLRQPGLNCEHDVADKYGRALAQCRTAMTPDIAAKQVADGLAVSHEFYGTRDYPDEEDAARDAMRGIWQGPFVRPTEWRARPKTSP